MEGFTLQVMIGSLRLLLHQMLSGHVQLDVMVLYIGMSGSSTIIMLCSVIKSRSGFIILAELYRCLLLLGSHRGGDG